MGKAPFFFKGNNLNQIFKTHAINSILPWGPGYWKILTLLTDPISPLTHFLNAFRCGMGGRLAMGLRKPKDSSGDPDISTLTCRDEEMGANSLKTR